MFPYRDDNPTLQVPIVTYVLIGLNVVAWLGLQGGGATVPLARSLCEFGAIPANLAGAIVQPIAVDLTPGLQCIVHADWAWHTPFTSMFMHGGWLHILGNMWFLWLFGNNVEDSMGRVRFAVFYVLCGLIACTAQVLAEPLSTAPMVGASGAIGGVMGAYIVLYPNVRVHMLVTLGFIFFTMRVPAFWMLFYWIALQVLGALPRVQDVGDSTAYWAHIGGFVAGAVLVKLFADDELVELHRRAWPAVRTGSG